LVANSLKFTSHGEVAVEVTQGISAAGVPFLHFLVRDTGIGIPVERQAAIFEAFTQVDGSTTRRYGGTGLGLTISKRLVEIMGGKIWVESEPGKGSTFHFTVPLESMTPHAEEPLVAARSDGSGVRQVAAPVHTARLRVLLAEDNLVNQKLARHILERNGYDLTIVSNGREAVEAVETRHYDIVLMDLQMPEMGGLEATEQIRKNEALRGGRIPIIAMTACAMTGDRERCLDAGMDGYVSKPIHKETLLRAIEDVAAMSRTISRPIQERHSATAGEQPPLRGRR
jgi:CheY-like chemotaxis protein